MTSVEGVRRIVEADVRLPANWGELFQYLAEKTTMLPCEANKCILSTSDTVVLSSSVDATPAISPCTHEEADTRLILHASDCARQGIDNIILHTVDTGVTVLAISNFSRLKISRLWIAFGVGKQYRYIPIQNHRQGSWGREISSVARFPRIDGLRSDIRILRTREEHSVDHMDVLWRSHYSFHSSKQNAYHTGCLKCYACAGKICSALV